MVVHVAPVCIRGVWYIATLRLVNARTCEVAARIPSPNFPIAMADSPQQRKLVTMTYVSAAFGTLFDRRLIVNIAFNFRSLDSLSLSCCTISCLEGLGASIF